MSKLVLIENLTPAQANIIAESTADGKDYYLSGIFMESELQNGNGRIYPKDEIEKAVNEANAKIAQGFTICGELNHPDNLSINLERVSHIITEMKMDGSKAIGKAKLLNTPMGNIAKNLIAGGVRVGVSSRGSGEVLEGKVNGFQFVTVDLVSNPSAPNAYPDVIRESIENPKIMSLAEAVVHDNDAQKYLAKEIFKFIESLKTK